MTVLEHLEPRKVFCFFEELCQIPHGTYDTKRISDYCVAFAKERGLEVLQDEVNNIIIKKPGTIGYEKSKPVILQGHLDMVCEKLAGSSHDFKTDALKLYIEDGYVKAKDTTLGGDDGIAVAMALAILDSDDIPHPPIEALFTTDEEVGMGGADAIDLSVLEGRKLINIDSEEEGILTIGCAGGIQYETVIPVLREKKSGILVRIRIHGLLGGHSGVEINKQRGNAHKMMGRLLYCIKKEIPMNLVSVDGGSKDNVISLESTANILIPADQEAKVRRMVGEMVQIWKEEFMGEEPGLVTDIEVTTDCVTDVFDEASTDHLITYLVICPNGVQEYSRKLEGLVETSVNIGVVETNVDSVRTVSLLRSSVESRKQQFREYLEICAKAVGGTGKTLNEYPAWQFRLESELRDTMLNTYKELYGKEPVVSTIHAGLECGLLQGKCPDLDCVSFGPNILDVHSVNERLDIASTQRTWEYLKAILKNCK
ncbi:aminoacyl-histidine dipeptidase [Bariatricus sp. SGI.154]|uniref:aminoacyl-histidine dipeptidase n=1 Tax=Bariatricus sp. SGI.154 TaxID=3420549 RepID=UPI003D06238A